MKNNLYVGLVHHPVNNKFGEEVTTSITNLDLHDISRSCLTFGVKKLFIINPLESQKEMYKRIVAFWQSDQAKKFNPHRAAALSLVEFANDIASVQNRIRLQETNCATITTTAIEFDHQIGTEELKKIERSYLLLFGTGYGLAKTVHTSADYTLKPIFGTGQYNHLSVRSAVAIYLDRLVSEK
jgi:hypothetical protein